MSTKLLIIGIDGATWTVLDPMIESGRLPNLATAKRDGASAKLKSTHPPVSSTAWASFATGLNPANHSVFNFNVKPLGAYYTEPVSSTNIAGTTLWEFLSRHGLKSAVLNVPLTYPPREINGLMITGLGTPDLSCNYTYPPEFAQEINDRFPHYTLDVNWTAYDDTQLYTFYEDIIAMTQTRYDLASYCLDKDAWDLFMVVFTGSDRILHRLWDFPMRNSKITALEANPESNLIISYFEFLDDIIGRLIQQSGDESTVIILSDHGFGPFLRDIDLNNWLAEQGYLSYNRNPHSNTLLRTAKRLFKALPFSKDQILNKLRSNPSKSEFYKYLEKASQGINRIDWQNTKAFSVSSNAIYINLKGRERHGIVSMGKQYEDIRQQIANDLYTLKDPTSGNNIFLTVSKKEQVYSGTYLPAAPDLIFTDFDRRYVGIDRIYMNNKDANIFLNNTKYQRGGHTLHGILIIGSNTIKKHYEIPAAEIIDLTPTILHLFGLPVPRDIDGRVLTDIFENSEKRNVQYQQNIANKPNRSHDSLTEEEKDKIMDRLRGLGYMD